MHACAGGRDEVRKCEGWQLGRRGCSQRGRTRAAQAGRGADRQGSAVARGTWREGGHRAVRAAAPRTGIAARPDEQATGGRWTRAIQGPQQQAEQRRRGTRRVEAAEGKGRPAARSRGGLSLGARRAGGSLRLLARYCGTASWYHSTVFSTCPGCTLPFAPPPRCRRGRQVGSRGCQVKCALAVGCAVGRRACAPAPAPLLLPPAAAPLAGGAPVLLEHDVDHVSDGDHPRHVAVVNLCGRRR